MARHDRAALPGPPRAVPLVPQAAPRATAPRPLSRALLRHGYWSRRAQRADRARQAAQLRRPATSAGCRTYRHCAGAAGEPAGCGSPMCSMQDRRARFSVMVSHSRVEREHHHHLHHRFRPDPLTQTRITRFPQRSTGIARHGTVCLPQAPGMARYTVARSAKVTPARAPSQSSAYQARDLAPFALPLRARARTAPTSPQSPCSLTSSAIPKPPPQCSTHLSGNAAPRDQ
jgi:hypothetical protein